MISPPLYADAALARRLERAEAQRLAAYGYGYARLHPGSRAEVLKVGGGVACFGEPGLYINRAAGLGLESPLTEAELQQVEDFYRRHEVPSRVELCPLAHPSMMELLGRRGYHVVRFLHVHFRPISPEDARTPAAPEGVEVAAVGPDEVELWVRTVAAGYVSEEGQPPSPLYLMLARLAAAWEGSRLYLARLRGEVAGAVALSVHDGLANLFSGATLPAFRRRGVHAAFTNAGLREAAALGCELATAITAPDGQATANVARAGFRVGYTRALLERELSGP
jgi:ribosomal protein S18 acetylase RimI-like enzyme